MLADLEPVLAAVHIRFTRGSSFDRFRQHDSLLSLLLPELRTGLGYERIEVDRI